MQVLEDVEQRTIAGERRDHVVDDDEERSLPLLRVARRLRRTGKMQELRERRRDQLRVREAERLELFGQLCGRFRVVRFDPQVDQERLDEAGVASLVHPRERPAQDAWGVGRADPVLRRGREPDEFGQQPGLADPRLAGDEHDLGPADAGGLV